MKARPIGLQVRSAVLIQMRPRRRTQRDVLFLAATATVLCYVFGCSAPTSLPLQGAAPNIELASLGRTISEASADLVVACDLAQLDYEKLVSERDKHVRVDDHASYKSSSTKRYDVVAAKVDNGDWQYWAGDLDKYMTQLVECYRSGLRDTTLSPAKDRSGTVCRVYLRPRNVQNKGMTEMTLRGVLLTQPNGKLAVDVKCENVLLIADPRDMPPDLRNGIQKQ